MEFLGAPTPFAAPAAGTVTVYSGATLLDGHGGPAVPGTSIVVDGERIRLVCPDADLPSDLPDLDVVERVDLTGRFVIPGLIDTHQHLATPPDRPVAEAVLRRQVFGGVTAIRDMADDLRQIGDLARATRVGEIPGPDIHYAALMAGPGFFDDPRTWEVSKGAVPGAVPWMQAITEDTDLPLAVAMARGTGATAVKIYADLPAETVAAITAEAHRQGLRVWAHAAVFPASPADVVAAGADVVSHVTLLAHQASAALGPATYKHKPPIDFPAFAAGDHPVIEALLADMRERGVVLDATAVLWTWLADRVPEERAEDRAHALDMAALAATLTRQAHRAGVEISAGTDYETSAGEDHPALIEEIEFLVAECGLSVAQALRSATLVGARGIGAEAEMGTVEAGKLANLVILAADPEADVAALRGVLCTVKRGLRFPAPTTNKD
ncbi:amidohydrolase family protein [Actinocorallia longicatena]|uniref:Amidohydrolase family protein n=1 Tax=Actinocorallia longicatena TaxID=111803 RepID=A0ABP6QKI0_9ACTN